MVSRDMEKRGRMIAMRDDAPVLAWTLYLDILVEAFSRATALGQIDELDRLASSLDDASMEFSNRLPNNPIPLNRRSQIMMLLGEPSDAALLARGARRTNQACWPVLRRELKLFYSTVPSKKCDKHKMRKSAKYNSVFCTKTVSYLPTYTFYRNSKAIN